MAAPVPHSKTWPALSPGVPGVEDLAFTDPRLSSLPSEPRVRGTLRLRGMKRLTEIPEGLFVGHSLLLTGCPKLRALPPITRPLRRLVLDGVGLESLPDGLLFEENAELVLQNCSRLRTLPAAVGTGKLSRITLRNCPRLTTLPDLAASGKITLKQWRGKSLERPMRAPSLSIRACPELERIDGPWSGARITVADCPKLLRMVAPLEEMAFLGLENCPALPALPKGLRFHGGPAELILRGCGALTALPSGMEARPAAAAPIPLVVEAVPWPPGQVPDYPFEWRLRVRNVLLDPATALHPDGIDPLGVLTHPNAEVRRVLLENLGMNLLLAKVPHTILDEDTDPGGSRRLIQFQLPVPKPESSATPPSLSERAGEQVGKLICRLFGSPAPKLPPQPPRLTRPVSFLDCGCPSTGRRYLLAVPPTLRTCRGSAAWMAGFDKAADYAPLLET
ncbi:MAG: hypothetical protein V4726_12085 [Verrucomicrobiota bacterium]